MKIMTVSYSLNDFELPETIILLTIIPKQRKKVTGIKTKRFVTEDCNQVFSLKENDLPTLNFLESSFFHLPLGIYITKNCVVHERYKLSFSNILHVFYCWQKSHFDWMRFSLPVD